MARGNQENKMPPAPKESGESQMPPPPASSSEPSKEPKAPEAKPEVKKVERPKTAAELFLELKESLPEGKPVMVVALRDGLYKGHRRPVGEKFQILDREHLGTWMKPI